MCRDRATMNGAVRAYLVSQGYKLTALTLSEEGGSSIPAKLPFNAPTLTDMFQGNNLKLVAAEAREVTQPRVSFNLRMLYSVKIRDAHVMLEDCTGCASACHFDARPWNHRSRADNYCTENNAFGETVACCWNEHQQLKNQLTWFHIIRNDLHSSNGACCFDPIKGTLTTM